MVTLEIKKDSQGIYRFYLKNSDNDPVSEVRIINNALKCRFSDKTLKSVHGTNEYFLNFSEKPSLSAGDRDETSPRLNIAGRGLCDVRNIEIAPLKGSYDTPAEITICYKKGEQSCETKMLVSWSGKYKVLSGNESTLANTLKKLLFSHRLLQGLIITIVGGVILLFIQRGCFRVELSSESECPTSSLKVAQLADRALWEGTQECGDRSVYVKLQMCFDQTRESELKSEYANQLKRIKNDYKTSILGPRARATRSVCTIGSMKGDSCKIEPEKGFLASNVIDHLDQKKYQRCTSRLRAAALLQNIDTAKGERDMKKAIELIVFILEYDPSLLVSKIALDRYSQFTGYSTSDIFDFEGAIDNWNINRKSGKSILLPEYCFDINKCL